MKKLLKIIGGIVVVLLLLLVGGTFVLNSSSFQNKMLKMSTEMLAEKLQTKVEIDSVNINLFTFDVDLLGVDIEDQQHEKILQAEKLAVNLDLWGLLRHHVKISKVDIEGVNAHLYQLPDGKPNYQFIIDAFKKDKTTPAPEKKKEKKKEKQQLTFDFDHVNIARIALTYDMVTKKGPQTMQAEMGSLKLKEKRHRQLVTIDSLHFVLDNHLPRKNEGKPKRGWFDAGHLDVMANLDLTINHLGNDSANIELTRFVAADTLTGFNVKDLRLKAGINFKRAAYLSDITVQQENTVLTFDSATVMLPSKKDGRKFAFHTSRISGKTLLKDISRPFAPVLQNFTMPLELSVLFSGTDTTLVFRDVEVHTPDRKLTITADGGIEHLNKSKELDIHFHVKEMHTNAILAEKIINMFTVKKLMIKQMKNLGDIRYTGDVSILYKKEAFKGLLTTSVGSLNFNFYIDENNKYIIGQANTTQFHLGKVLEMKDLADVGLNANFKIDIDKPRTLRMRKQYGGNLPIGDVKAVVSEAGYKGIRVRGLNVDATSNGGQLDGNISQQNKGLDWACDFSITDLNKISTLKVKPKVKVKVKEIIPVDKLKSLNPFKKKKKKESTD